MQHLFYSFFTYFGVGDSPRKIGHCNDCDCVFYFLRKGVCEPNVKMCLSFRFSLPCCGLEILPSRCLSTLDVVRNTNEHRTPRTVANGSGIFLDWQGSVGRAAIWLICGICARSQIGFSFSTDKVRRDTRIPRPAKHTGKVMQQLFPVIAIDR